MYFVSNSNFMEDIYLEKVKDIPVLIKINQLIEKSQKTRTDSIIFVEKNFSISKCLIELIFSYLWKPLIYAFNSNNNLSSDLRYLVFLLEFSKWFYQTHVVNLTDFLFFTFLISFKKLDPSVILDP